MVVLLVVVAAAVVVAGVPGALSVPVVLVALPVPVMLLVGLVLRRAAVPVVILIGTLADSGRGSRGDPAAARSLRGRDPRAGRRSGGGRGCAGAARGRSLAGADRRNRAGRFGRLERRRDDGGDLAGSGRRRGNRDLGTGGIEEVWRSQNEADRGQYGEQADYGCGYARKTTPHNLSHRRVSAYLES